MSPTCWSSSAAERRSSVEVMVIPPSPRWGSWEARGIRLACVQPALTRSGQVVQRADGGESGYRVPEEVESARMQC